MLYRLEIENFGSIKELQVIDLRIGRGVPDYPERFAPIHEGSDIRAPKVVAIFGPNGSGKTTVLKALSFLAWFVQSFGPTADARLSTCFNDEEGRRSPIRLAIELGATQLSDDMKNGSEEPRHSGAYRYELELEVADTGPFVVSLEALRQKKAGQAKWSRVFERRKKTSIVGSKDFPLTGYSQVIDKIRDDASTIATLALFEHAVSKRIISAANRVSGNILFQRADLQQDQLERLFASAPALVADMNRELQRIDVGIEQMDVLSTPTGPQLYFKHHGLKRDMPLEFESHGTRSFIELYPLLRRGLLQGGIAIVDELDQAIHPIILPEILRWFYDPERNPHNAQLWMSCLSVSLLEDLLKEEVVLCEKSPLGQSTVYSLMDMQSVRRSDNLYKKYLGGVYGAVPHIG